MVRSRREKAQIDVMAVEHNVEIDTSELNRIFCAYAMKYFGKLSSEINLKSPVLVSNAMDYIHDHSEKAAIIVMDGMSEFDWTILKDRLQEFAIAKVQPLL